MATKSSSPPRERPLELVFVRHGESEGNVANEAAKVGDTSKFTTEFRAKHSSTWDLTPRGIEQAKITGAWIVSNINGGVFDGYYCSTYKRAKRTAGFLGLPAAQWYVRDYLREHDWGNLDAMTNEERRQKYPDVMKLREINRYYFSSPGGESLATVVIRARVGIISSLYRDLPGKRGIAVTHGNFIWPIRMILEGLLPEDYLEAKAKDDPMDEINNCQVLHYSRIDPQTKEVNEKFTWVRSVCPWDLSRSSNDWRKIQHKKYSNEELVRI